MASALDAIQKVLELSTKPLHYQEITDQIIENKLWETESVTPHNTIAATLSTDLRNNGAKSRFIKTSRGYYGLRNKKYPKSPNIEFEPEYASDEKLSFNDAAEVILDQSGKPEMHYKEIMKRILNQKLIVTESKSPEATLYASILQENKRFENRGETPRFDIRGKGLIGLTKRMPKGVEGEIQARNEKTRDELLKRLKKMKPDEFEKLISILLIRIGFEEVETTAYHGDNGIDVRGTLVVGDVIRTRLAAKVKDMIQIFNLQQFNNFVVVSVHTNKDYSLPLVTLLPEPKPRRIGLVQSQLD